MIKLPKMETTTMLGRRKPSADIPIKCTRLWKGIVWHHSKAQDGLTYDWDANKGMPHVIPGKWQSRISI